MERPGDCCFAADLFEVFPGEDGVCYGYVCIHGNSGCVCSIFAGKVGMSVLTKGLAMDFVRQGRKEMAITSIWPATVSHTASVNASLD